MTGLVADQRMSPRAVMAKKRFPVVPGVVGLARTAHQLGKTMRLKLYPL